LFTIVLASSLLIERILEVLKSVLNLFDSRYDWHIYWTKKAQALRDKFERKLNVFEYVEPRQMAKYLRRFQGLFIDNIDDGITHVPVISGDFARSFYIKMYAKILALILGIGMAFWFKIDLLTIWESYSDYEVNLLGKSIRIIITGMIIGLGSSPVHKIITSIEKRKEKKQSKNK
jgi:hypothetical protein